VPSHAAVAALFATEYERLVGSLAVGFGKSDAEDAVQEAFVQALVSWKRVSTYEDPAGWVRRVAVNRLLNRQRDRSRRRRILSGMQSSLPEGDASHDVDALVLRSQVANLPARMRAAVCLHYLCDLTVAQTADALAVSSGTVKSTLSEARMKLASSMEGTELWTS